MSCASKNTQGPRKRNFQGAVRISEATSRKPTEWQWSSQPKHLFNKLDGEGPLGPVSASARHTGTIIARNLETVHPNPGPTRKGKTKRSEENKKLRNIRRQTKRRERRKLPPDREIKVVTWNLQGISMREKNRARLKRTNEFIQKNGWEITIIPETRSDKQGVIWMGKGEKTVAIIHSLKTGIILWGSALDQWIRGNQKMEFRERALLIQIDKMCIISVYQPLKTHGEDTIDVYRKDVEDLLVKIPSDCLMIMGGDHNAHVGKASERDGVSGKYGLETPTNEQGRDLLDWCQEHNLEWVNSFSNHAKRGTWFNKSSKRWYELDGFIMRASQRHRHAKKMRTVDELSYSDHKPVCLYLKTKMRKWRVAVKPPPNIKWEALRQEDKQQKFREKTAELMMDDEIGIERDWDQISSILVQAARTTCGMQTKRVENPWIKGNEGVLENLQLDINRWVKARNEAKEKKNKITQKVFQKKLSLARKNMKKQLRNLEQQWWDERLVECQEAAERGDFGSMYSLLHTLGTRSSKPLAGTKLTTQQFKEHFENISSRRYENDPSVIMQAFPPSRIKVMTRTGSKVMNSLTCPPVKKKSWMPLMK